MDDCQVKGGAGVDPPVPLTLNLRLTWRKQADVSRQSRFRQEKSITHQLQFLLLGLECDLRAVESLAGLFSRADQMDDANLATRQRERQQRELVE